MKAHEKAFLSNIEDLKNTFNTIKNNPSFIYNPDKPDGAHLINISFSWRRNGRTD